MVMQTIDEEICWRTAVRKDALQTMRDWMKDNNYAITDGVLVELAREISESIPTPDDRNI